MFLSFFNINTSTQKKNMLKLVDFDNISKKNNDTNNREQSKKKSIRKETEKFNEPLMISIFTFFSLVFIVLFSNVWQTNISLEFFLCLGKKRYCILVFLLFYLFLFLVFNFFRFSFSLSFSNTHINNIKINFHMFVHKCLIRNQKKKKSEKRKAYQYVNF